MRVNRSVTTWGVIIGLIIISGLLSAFWPTIRAQIEGATPDAPSLSGPSIDTEVDQIVLSNPLSSRIGPDEIIFNEWIALIALTVLISGPIVVTGVILAILYTRIDRTAVSLKQDEEFQKEMRELEQREQAIVKELKQEQPPNDPLPHKPSSMLVSMSLVFAVLMAFLGAAFSENFTRNNNQFLIAMGFAFLGLFYGVIGYARQRQAASSEDDDYSPVPWGTIFVILTGLLLVGLGLGVMFWVRAQGVAT